jgi:hypothetical protein
MWMNDEDGDSMFLWNVGIHRHVNAKTYNNNNNIQYVIIICRSCFRVRAPSYMWDAARHGVEAVCYSETSTTQHISTCCKRPRAVIPWYKPPWSGREASFHFTDSYITPAATFISFLWFSVWAGCHKTLPHGWTRTTVSNKCIRLADTVLLNFKTLVIFQYSKRFSRFSGSFLLRTGEEFLVPHMRIWKQATTSNVT